MANIRNHQKGDCIMEIKARIPGMITAVNVSVGDAVKVKTIVGVMEAMKMEQPIASPVEGQVKEIRVAVKDKVKAGQVLMVIE